jgi:hypothetical protein
MGHADGQQRRPGEPIHTGPGDALQNLRLKQLQP